MPYSREQQDRRNARRRERYATDPDYREKVKARGRANRRNPKLRPKILERDRQRRRDFPEQAVSRRVLRRVAQFRGCAICGYNQSGYALDWHHRGPKRKCVATHPHLKHMLEEIDFGRCIVLCANCHRQVHAGEIECP